MAEKATIEQYAIALAQHLVRTYPLVRPRHFALVCWAGKKLRLAPLRDL